MIAGMKQPIATKQAILEAAFIEIYQYGFQSASINRILKHLDISKGALYHHFGDKKQLGLAVIEKIIAKRLDNSIFIPLSQSEQAIITLIDILEDFKQNISQQNVILGCPLNNLMQEMSAIDEDFKTELYKVLEKWQNSIYQGLEKARLNKVIQANCDCKATALFIVSAWEGCIGIAKNLQSETAYKTCLTQLQKYIKSIEVTHI